MTVRRYTIVAEFDDSIFHIGRRAEIQFMGQTLREQAVCDAIRRDVPNLAVRSVCEVEMVEIAL